MAPIFVMFWTLFYARSSFALIKPNSEGFYGICKGSSILQQLVAASDECNAAEILRQRPTPNVTEVDQMVLEREIDNLHSGAYMAVLFYASWCPFSMSFHGLYHQLSAMFPKIQHFAVEECVVMPSVLSRYGVHSFPALFILNQTARFRYKGQKDIHSVVHFYHETTGMEQIRNANHFKNERLKELPELRPFKKPLKNLLHEEPYMAFAVLFIVLRVLVGLYPKSLVLLRHCRLRRMWSVNLALLGEYPLLKHTLHFFKLHKIWTQYKFSKKGNLQEGAKNARALASLASVSLGKGPVNRGGCSNETS